MEPDDLLKALGSLGVDPAGEDATRLAALANGSVSEALKLVNYGGGEIIDAYHETLAGSDAEARALMHRLADTLAKRDNETVFAFLLAHVEEDVRSRAREAAMGGEIARAERLSALSLELGNDVATADAYNLDRKQLVLDLLTRIRAAVN